MRKRAPVTTAPFASGSAENVLGRVVEPIVNHGHQSDHDGNEEDHHGGVRRQLVAGGPDDLAELRDDLAVEEGKALERALLGSLAALAGLLLGLRHLVLGIRRVDGAHGVRHSSSPDSGSWPCRARSSRTAVHCCTYMR